MFLFKNEPVAKRRVTHSIGIISHFLAIKALSDADLIKAVSNPILFLTNQYYIINLCV